MFIAAVREVRFTSGMGVNYTKMQNIRLDKKLPLNLQFISTRLVMRITKCPIIISGLLNFNRIDVTTLLPVLITYSVFKQNVSSLSRFPNIDLNAF